MLVCKEGDSMRTKDGSTDVFRDFLKYVSFNILGQCAYSCYTLAGLFCSGQIVRLLGADDTVFQMTNTYLRVMLLFSPAFLLNNLLQCFVRNDGNPSLSMAAMIIGSLSNVVLDYIFIFPMRMGILGAILATGMAPLISMAVLSSCFIKRKNQFHLVRCGFGGKRTAEILFNGVPSLITEASSGIVMVVFNFIILRLGGNVGVAAFGDAALRCRKEKGGQKESRIERDAGRDLLPYRERFLTIRMEQQDGEEWMAWRF